MKPYDESCCDRCSELPFVVGKAGERVQDGPIGIAILELTRAVEDYALFGQETDHANSMATLAMDLAYLVMELYEELCFVEPA